MGFSDPNINRVLYIIIAFVGIGIITAVYVLKFKTLKCFVKACLMMIGFGALGNLIDRLFYAQSSFHVVDWINFYGIWDFHFNIADSAIVVGVIMLVVWLIVDEVKDYIKNKPAKVESKEKVLSSEEQRRQDEFAAQSDEETSK